MYAKKNILVFSRDRSILDENSQFAKRVARYAEYHSFTFVLMDKGEIFVGTIHEAQVIAPGGKSLAGAFTNALSAARKELKQKKYDLITTQDVLYAGLVGYLLCRLFKLPLFVQVHGDYLGNERWFKSKIGKFNRLMNPIGVYILKRADHVRAVSERLRQDLIKKYSIQEDKIVSIPIGTDLALFRSDFEAPRKKQIFFAQRLIPEKCPLLFASVVTKIMKEHHDVTTVIAGDGFMKAELVTYFKEQGVDDRVQFLGALPQIDLVRLYQTSMVYLHTADWEGWGMPMIEAMAAGCPVVTTDTGCAGEAVRHEETGLVTSSNDETALVRETKRLLTDESLWNRLSTASITEAAAWSIVSLTKKNMEWYGQ